MSKISIEIIKTKLISVKEVDVMPDSFALDTEKYMKESFFYIRNHLFLEKTGLIYDHIAVGQEKEFPTAAEISSCFPNPGGNSTGMEDGMINGATMLDACLIKYEKESDSLAAEFAPFLWKMESAIIQILHEISTRCLPLVCIGI